MTVHTAPAAPPKPPLRYTLVGAAAQILPPAPGLIRAALRTAPRGDGHPVLVVPSFLRGDRNTLPLRRFLAGCGYVAYGWNLGTNLGPTEAVLRGVDRRLDEIREKHRCRVSLIGHSLGGVIAREMAKRRPDDIRLLITIASPIRLPTASPIEPLYRLLARWQGIDLGKPVDMLNRPPEVPVTAIFTRTDGIVSWQSCLETPGPQRESIAVPGSHGTMVRNPGAWRIVADRLAQPEGQWRPYRPSIKTA